VLCNTADAADSRLSGVRRRLVSANVYIPYGDSALTWLLKDCFGLNCCTTLLTSQSTIAHVYVDKNVKSFPIYKVHRAAMISFSWPSARHPFTLRDHQWRRFLLNSGGRHGEHGARAYNGGLGQSPQRGQGVEPLVRGSGPLKLKEN